MDTIFALTAVLGLALTIATAAGAFFAFRASKNSQLIEVYQGTANAWQERAAAYSDQIKELQQENQKLNSELADLRGQVNMLKDLATGNQVITALITKVDRIATLLEGLQHGCSSISGTSYSI